jgi:hypothetical protein
MTPPVHPLPMEALQRVALRAMGRAASPVLEPVRPTPFERPGSGEGLGDVEEITEQLAAPPTSSPVRSSVELQLHPPATTAAAQPSSVQVVRPPPTSGEGPRPAAQMLQRPVEDPAPRASRIEDRSSLRVITDDPRLEREAALVAPPSRGGAPRPPADEPIGVLPQKSAPQGAFVTLTASSRVAEPAAELRPQSTQPHLPERLAEAPRPEPTRIEVSIGRLEVRTPPPRQAPQPPPRSQPTTLDRYLGRRNQGSRS